MLEPPPTPDVPARQRATGTIELRYEDVSQDGRVVLTALPHAMGIVWRNLVRSPFPQRVREEGIVPLLTRIVVRGGDGPVSVRNPLEACGCYQLAHTRDEHGAVERIVLLMWVEVSAPKGRTHGPPPPDAGTTVLVGRAFAEHVFTRPFAPPGRRKVVALPVAPEVPSAPWTWRPPAGIADLPEGARWLDEAMVASPAITSFGLDHTDSNRHVNSLVYPRLFLDAALARLAALGRPTARIARLAEIGYRKPFFAGDRARLHVRAFAHGDRDGIAGVLTPEAAPDPTHGHCYARLVFSD